MGLKRSQNEIPECRHAKNKAPNDFLKSDVTWDDSQRRFFAKKKKQKQTAT